MNLWARSFLFDAAGPDTLRDAVAKTLPGRASLVLVFASPAHRLETLTAALAPDHATVVGCSSAGEFVGERGTKQGIAVFAVGGDVVATAGLGQGLRASPDRAVADALAGQPGEVEGHPHRTGILLIDPLSGVGEEAALLVAERLGDVALAGGAAGDDLAMKTTTVALGGVAASDALVVVQLFTKAKLGLGVRHGHRPISGSLRVTKASGSVVHELDGRPAWDVWREQTRAAASAAGIDVDRLANADAGSFLLRFEAGLTVLDGIKVRAPLRLEGQGIAFATAVPEGSVLRITEGTGATQVESAIAAASDARAALGGRPVAGALVFDCICRNLILGPEFDRAVSGMAAALDGAPLAGFETYGEIALHDGALSGFHNTTSVVLAFPRDDG